MNEQQKNSQCDCAELEEQPENPKKVLKTFGEQEVKKTLADGIEQLLLLLQLGTRERKEYNLPKRIKQNYLKLEIIIKKKLFKLIQKRSS